MQVILHLSLSSPQTQQVVPVHTHQGVSLSTEATLISIQWQSPSTNKAVMRIAGGGTDTKGRIGEQKCAAKRKIEREGERGGGREGRREKERGGREGERRGGRGGGTGEREGRGRGRGREGGERQTDRQTKR